MVISGYYHNGVVVLEGGTVLPEGTPVQVFPLVDQQHSDVKPIPFPLVRSSRPGSMKLTNERIAEILEEDDLSS